jgi:catalase
MSKPARTLTTGAPIAENPISASADWHGALMAKDYHHRETLAHQNHERTPERAVYLRARFSESDPTYDCGIATRAGLSSRGFKTADAAG